MAKVFKLMIIPCGVMLCLGAARANIPNNSKPLAYTGSTFQGTYAGWIAGNPFAYSLLLELGAKNKRIGGTLGFRRDAAQKFKISADYLVQAITYSYWSGNTKRWAQQGDLSADYQYGFGWTHNMILDVNAYTSYAQSKRLSTVTGFYPRYGIHKPYVPFIDNRRVAGSWAAGVNPGLDFRLWENGVAGIGLTYDYVHYHKSYNPSETANGLGGNAHLDVDIVENIRLGLSAALRQPFYNYAASLSWDNLYFSGRWNIGLFGDYTSGNNTLPSTYNIGLSLNYFADRVVTSVFSAMADYKTEVPFQETSVDKDFLSWMTRPAVYMPQVLAVADDHAVM